MKTDRAPLIHWIHGDSSNWKELSLQYRKCQSPKYVKEFLSNKFEFSQSGHVFWVVRYPIRVITVDQAWIGKFWAKQIKPKLYNSVVSPSSWNSSSLLTGMEAPAPAASLAWLNLAPAN